MHTSTESTRDQDDNEEFDWSSDLLHVLVAYSATLSERIRDRKLRDQLDRVDSWLTQHGMHPHGHESILVRQSIERSARLHRMMPVTELFAEFTKYVDERVAAGEDRNTVVSQMLAAGERRTRR